VALPALVPPDDDASSVMRPQPEARVHVHSNTESWVPMLNAIVR